MSWREFWQSGTYFQVLVRAEAGNRFALNQDVEGIQEEVPSLATLVTEILCVHPDDDEGNYYDCICPGTDNGALDAHELARVMRDSWIERPRSFCTRRVYTSPLFRRLHCDLVANTISADLMDYIRRDTRVAGLPRDLDRRFYSYVSSAPYRGRQRVVVRLEDRQGHVRRDVLSDLMNCLEIRYIIHERIVLHRAVVAARAMAARLYAPISRTSDAGSTESLWDLVEQMYGPWNEWASDAAILGRRDHKGDFNMALARMLQRRQLYRPIVIVDTERLRRHGVSLPDEAKWRLARQFGGQPGGTESAPK